MNDIQTKNRKKEIYRITWIGSASNVFLFVFKFIAGVLGNSAAMIADAVHSLSDFITDIFVIVFVKISSKPEDNEYEYGHGKYETLATFIISALLLLAGLGIAVNGIIEIIDWFKGHEIKKPGMIALVAAAISIVLKEGIYRYTVKVGKKLKSAVVIANAWHHRSDAWSSVGTLIGIGGAIVLGERWGILDPLAALIVSIFIIHVAIDMMRPAAQELMEKSLPDSVQKRIREIVEGNDGVRSLHNLRTRRIGNRIAIEFHVRMDGNQSLLSAHAYTMEIERRLKEEFGNDTHIIIHMEPLNTEYIHENKTPR